MNPFKFLTQTKTTQLREQDQQFRLDQAFDRFKHASDEHKVVCTVIQQKAKRQGTATQVACKLIAKLG